MSPVTRLWILYALLGLALSNGLIFVQNTLSPQPLISENGIVFGVMFAIMGLAMRKVERRHRGIFH